MNGFCLTGADAQRRLSSVQDTLADWAATGQLETVWKGDGPGAPVPIKPEMWQFGDTALLIGKVSSGARFFL